MAEPTATLSRRKKSFQSSALQPPSLDYLTNCSTLPRNNSYNKGRPDVRLRNSSAGKADRAQAAASKLIPSENNSRGPVGEAAKSARTRTKDRYDLRLCSPSRTSSKTQQELHEKQQATKTINSNQTAPQLTASSNRTRLAPSPELGLTKLPSVNSDGLAALCDPGKLASARNSESAEAGFSSRIDTDCGLKAEKRREIAAHQSRESGKLGANKELIMKGEQVVEFGSKLGTHQTRSKRVNRGSEEIERDSHIGLKGGVD